jgi:hypothetical protein
MVMPARAAGLVDTRGRLPIRVVVHLIPFDVEPWAVIGPELYIDQVSDASAEDYVAHNLGNRRSRCWISREYFVAIFMSPI